MKRIIVGRFRCSGCSVVQNVELEYDGQVPDLPEGWCGINGWWRETQLATQDAATLGEAPAMQGKATPQMDKLPLDAECCSYECMENFLKGALLRGDARTHKLVNELTPLAATEEKPC